MNKCFLVFILLFGGLYGNLFGQTPQVPSEMEVADLTLKITEGARKEIQTHVNALYRSEKYFKIKLERVDLYFPIIEKIFREENLPLDFKYLVIQESALVSDAVSSSNAVGFWQFKKASGEEVGLRVDGVVDERLNIVSSTRGAARYLKRNNNYFDNWLYTLLSYNMGAGGAQKVVDDRYFGAKRMEIRKNTHWYIIKFLAHKVAFEHAVGKNPNPELTLVEYTAGANKNLKQIAKEVDIDSELLEEYNKWLKRGSVPDDKLYTVLIPTPYGELSEVVAINQNEESVSSTEVKRSAPSFGNRFSKGSDKYPIIEGDVPTSKDAVLVTVNGKPGIIAGENDNLLSLAEKGDVSISRFLRYNDLSSKDKAIPGQVYYLKNKRRKAAEHYHVVLETENLWSISQKYGIKVKKLLQRNRMKKGEQPKPGRVLWMRFIRPSDEPITYKNVAVSERITSQSDAEPELPEEVDPVKDISENTAPSDEHIVASGEVNDIGSDIPVERQSEDIEQEADIQQVSMDDEQEANPSSFEPSEDIRFVEAESTSEFNNPKAKNETHTVKEGETLYGIARQHGIKLGDLLYWNDLSIKDGLKPDQVLKITAPEGEPASQEASSGDQKEEFIIHEVVSGETMYKIARDHNVTIKDVMQWNDKEDFKVSIGEKLKIKNK